MGSTRPPVGVALSLLAAIAALIVGCGGSSGDADRSSSSADTTAGASKATAAEAVTIRDFVYEPETISVPVGTTLSVDNRDSAPHTVTSKQSGAFESGTIDGGKSGEVTLQEPGTFAYYCLFHPFMKGAVIVE